MNLCRLLLVSLLFIASSCNHISDRSISFYYWRTSFHLNDYEKKTLQHNAVNTLYVRYCDVDIKPGAAAPTPVSPISFDTAARPYNIVPVVFIRNRTFMKIDAAGVRTLADSVLKLVTQINNSLGIKPPEIQFDCDWTETTKDNYFLFLAQYRFIASQRTSCTIRLHQVKYPGKTGIPPVNYGTLMYYNMGNINAGPQNSIYEKSIADRYNSFISSYPLTLDVALPVFSWGLKVQEGKVVELLNKIYFTHFKNDSNFRYVRQNWFTTVHPCFKAGYYFAQGDNIKIENVTAGELLEMAGQINKNSNDKLRNIIFYDLDSANLVQYEKDIYKKVMGRLD